MSEYANVAFMTLVCIVVGRVFWIAREAIEQEWRDEDKEESKNEVIRGVNMLLLTEGLSRKSGRVIRD